MSLRSFPLLRSYLQDRRGVRRTDVCACDHSGRRADRRGGRLQPRQLDPQRRPGRAGRDRARDGETRPDTDADPAGDQVERLFPGVVQPSRGQDPHRHADLYHHGRLAADADRLDLGGHDVHEGDGLHEPRHQEHRDGEVGQPAPARRACARHHRLDGERRQDRCAQDRHQEPARPAQGRRERRRRRLCVDHSVQQGCECRHGNRDADWLHWDDGTDKSWDGANGTCSKSGYSPRSSCQAQNTCSLSGYNSQSTCTSAGTCSISGNNSQDQLQLGRHLLQPRAEQPVGLHQRQGLLEFDLQPQWTPAGMPATPGATAPGRPPPGPPASGARRPGPRRPTPTGTAA